MGAIGFNHTLHPIRLSLSAGGCSLVSWCPLRLLVLLCCFLRPLLQHTHAALRQQDMLTALHQGITLNDELVLLVGGQAVLHPVPLPEGDHDVPGHAWGARDGW